MTHELVKMRPYLMALGMQPPIFLVNSPNPNLRKGLLPGAAK